MSRITGTGMAVGRVVENYPRAKAALLRELESLGHDIARATRDIKDDATVDEHLVQNGGMRLARAITSYNLLRDLNALIESDAVTAIVVEKP